MVREGSLLLFGRGAVLSGGDGGSASRKDRMVLSGRLEREGVPLPSSSLLPAAPEDTLEITG